MKAILKIYKYILKIQLGQILLLLGKELHGWRIQFAPDIVEGKISL